MAFAQVNIRYISNTKGGQTLVVNEYQFCVKSRRNDITYWQCCMKKIGCSARVTVRDGILASPLPQHNHPSDELKIAVQEVVQQMKTRVKADCNSVHSLYKEKLRGDVNAAIPDDVDVMTTSPKVNKISLLPFITRFIRHEKESCFSETPMLGCFPDLIETLPLSRCSADTTEPLPTWRRCCFPEMNASYQTNWSSNQFANENTVNLPARPNPEPTSITPTQTEAKTKKFECEICRKKLATKACLANHMRRHTDNTRFKCEVCCNTFTMKRDLAVHMRKHTGEKPYKCPQCDMRFASSSNFAKHKRVHGGHKPYKCTGCEKTFSQSSNLTRHRQIYNH